MRKEEMARCSDELTYGCEWVTKRLRLNTKGYNQIKWYENACAWLALINDN